MNFRDLIEMASSGMLIDKERMYLTLADKLDDQDEEIEKLKERLEAYE